MIFAFSLRSLLQENSALYHNFSEIITINKLLIQCNQLNFSSVKNIDQYELTVLVHKYFDTLITLSEEYPILTAW